ncbi:hypothetical protein Bca52824_019842 [Brassica carinata]|uniref:F-box domain-containing protein n=1 Tax=Brassica carinata TaxID=52824 RepID=A0A8X8AZ00_BRACI|nr:hypothetical protein Bca52824_019842 [Brassica carinata]
MEKWSELPSEILHSISLRIDNPFDLIHFRKHPSVFGWLPPNFSLYFLSCRVFELAQEHVVTPHGSNHSKVWGKRKDSLTDNHEFMILGQLSFIGTTSGPRILFYRDQSKTS